MTFFENLLWLGGLASAVLILGSGPAQGLLPPEKLQERNLTAAEILIGRVVEVAPAPDDWRRLLPPLPAGEAAFFTLQITHVVKSRRFPRPGEQVKVLFVVEKPVAPGLGAKHSGWSAVQVAAGDLVIVYANPASQDGQDVLLPLLAGASVLRLAADAPSQGPPVLPKTNR